MGDPWEVERSLTEVKKTTATKALPKRKRERGQKLNEKHEMSAEHVYVS